MQALKGQWPVAGIQWPVAGGAPPAGAEPRRDCRSLATAGTCRSKRASPFSPWQRPAETAPARIHSISYQPPFACQINSGKYFGYITPGAAGCWMRPPREDMATGQVWVTPLSAPDHAQARIEVMSRLHPVPAAAPLAPIPVHPLIVPRLCRIITAAQGFIPPPLLPEDHLVKPGPSNGLAQLDRIQSIPRQVHRACGIARHLHIRASTDQQPKLFAG